VVKPLHHTHRSPGGPADPRASQPVSRGAQDADALPEEIEPELLTQCSERSGRLIDTDDPLPEENDDGVQILEEIQEGGAV
jgi:hypothetical protein